MLKRRPGNGNNNEKGDNNRNRPHQNPFKRIEVALGQDGTDEDILRTIHETVDGPQLSGVSRRLKDNKKIGWNLRAIGNAAIIGAILGPFFGGGVICSECRSEAVRYDSGCACVPDTTEEYYTVKGDFSRAIGVYGAKRGGVIGAWFAGLLAGAAGAAAIGAAIGALAGLRIRTEQEPVVSNRDIVQGIADRRKRWVWHPPESCSILATTYNDINNTLDVYFDTFEVVTLDCLTRVEKGRKKIDQFEVIPHIPKSHLTVTNETGTRTFLGNSGTLTSIKDGKEEWYLQLIEDDIQIPIWNIRKLLRDERTYPSEPIHSVEVFYCANNLLVLRKGDPSIQIIHPPTGNEMGRYTRPEHVGTVPCHPMRISKNSVSVPFYDGYLTVLNMDGGIIQEFEMGPGWANLWLAGFNKTHVFVACPSAVAAFTL